AGVFQRLGNPEVWHLGSGKEGVAAIFVVEQHAKAVAAIGDAGGGVDGEDFELRDFAARHAKAIGDIFELDAVINGEGFEGRVIAAASRGGPMNVIDAGVFAQSAFLAAVGEEIL